jgi:hypothetical protein
MEGGREGERRGEGGRQARREGGRERGGRGRGGDGRRKEGGRGGVERPHTCKVSKTVVTRSWPTANNTKPFIAPNTLHNKLTINQEDIRRQ